MECQILFLGENKKNISKCHLLKFVPSMLCVKVLVLAADKKSIWKIVFFAKTYSNMDIYMYSLELPL